MSLSVSGLQTGKIEPRLEIDEFALDTDVLNLFLLALIELQNKPYDDPWSWFQIAGIHGRPFAPWGNLAEAQQSANVGYCAHSSVTFPTWHRPYVSMMEQAVYAEVLKQANAFEDDQTKERYLKAASRFRFPYWDPCLPRQLDGPIPKVERQPTSLPYEFGIPRMISNPEVYLRFPNSPGELVKVDNPLYQYKFPKELQDPDNSGGFWEENSDNVLFTDLSLNGTKHTVRAPNEKGITSDRDINKYVWTHLQSDIGSNLFKVLTGHSKWITFSNNVFDNEEEEKAAAANRGYIHATLEGFHDNVHVFLGQGTLGTNRDKKGSGHIGHPSYAAFDPIFWLHHCNVDRITAIFQSQQVGNIDAWWKEEAAGEASYNMERGTTLKPSDGLPPFQDPVSIGSKEPFWTSDGIRNWTKLGYTYHGKYITRNKQGQNELVTFPILPEGTKSSEINSYINQFYAWSDLPVRSYPAILSQFYPVDLAPVEALTGKDMHKRTHPHIGLPSHLDRLPKDLPDPRSIDIGDIFEGILFAHNKIRQWDLHILAEKFHLNNSYQVFVFLGPFDADHPDSWPTDQYLVGINGIFANDPTAGGCANCEQQAESKLTVMDIIPLTRHLIRWIRSGNECPPDADDAVIIKTLEYEQVQRFLKKNLHWRIADMHLNPYVGEYDFVKVSVVDRVVRLPTKYEDAVRFGEEDDDEKDEGDFEGGDAEEGEQGTNPLPASVPVKEKPDGLRLCGLRCTVM